MIQNTWNGKCGATSLMDAKTVGCRIANRRRDLHLSQNELAEKLYATVGTVSKYENDKIDFRLSVLQELSVELGTTVSYLVDGPGDPEEEELVDLFQKIEDPKMKQLALGQMRVMVEMQ